MPNDPRPPAAPDRSRRQALAALGLLLAAALAACKNDVQPGSGVETIRHSRERSPPSGR